MYFHAAKSAAQPNSSTKAPSGASLSSEERKSSCALLTYCGNVAARKKTVVEANTRRRDRENDFGAWGIFRSVSRPLLGVTLRAQTGALRLGVVLLRLQHPYGVSVPPKRSLRTAVTKTTQTSLGPRQESTPWHLGAGPTRLASPV